MSQKNSIAQMGSYNAKGEAGYSMAQMGQMEGAKYFIHHHFYSQDVVVVVVVTTCTF